MVLFPLRPGAFSPPAPFMILLYQNKQKKLCFLSVFQILFAESTFLFAPHKIFFGYNP